MSGSEKRSKERRKRSHSPTNLNTTDEEDKTKVKEGKARSKEEEDAVVIPPVHSANSWESVDLGDEHRKAKFLKLMGAAKKDHRGKIIIGEQVATGGRHGRSTDEIEKLESNLEVQFEHCLDDRVKHKNKKHCGLGFKDDGDHQGESQQQQDIKTPIRRRSTEQQQQQSTHIRFNQDDDPNTCSQ